MSVYRPTSSNKEPVKWRKIIYKHENCNRNFRFYFILVASVILLFNSIIIGNYFGFISLPGEMSDLDIAKHGAVMYINSFKDKISLNESVNVSLIRNIISRYESDIMNFQSREEIGFALSNMISELSKAMIEERLDLANKRLLEILSQDDYICGNEKATGYILVSTIGGNVNITDNYNLVKKDTREIIKTDVSIINSPQPIAVVVTNGLIELEMTNIETRIETLNNEIEVLKSMISQINQESGFTEVMGKGLIIRAYDAISGSSWDEIVHDADIINIISTLMNSGAKGVQIGSERIIATSSVRCVGAVVLINHRPIAVNPINIAVVGDQDDMYESLVKIVEEFESTGKKLEIMREDNVALDAYRKAEVNW